MISELRSFFIGAGIAGRVAFVVVFAPLTCLWLLGERHEGRQRDFWETNLGGCVAVSSFFWLVALVVGSFIALARNAN